MVLQSCYRGVTEVLRRCYSRVTVVLQMGEVRGVRYDMLFGDDLLEYLNILCDRKHIAI